MKDITLGKNFTTGNGRHRSLSLQKIQTQLRETFFIVGKELETNEEHHLYLRLNLNIGQRRNT